MTAIQKSVYISGLPSTFTEQDLCKAFQDIGGVESCRIVKTVVGTSSGTAYVQFDEVTKATNTVKKVTEEKVMKATMVPEDRHDEFNLLMTPKSTTRREDSTVQPSTVIVQETPKVTVFSGSPGKDCSFGRWRYEVECMINSKTYNQQTILHAVRKSLRSPAAELITHLDNDATWMSYCLNWSQSMDQCCLDKHYYSDFIVKHRSKMNPVQNGLVGWRILLIKLRRR